MGFWGCHPDLQTRRTSVDPTGFLDAENPGQDSLEGQAACLSGLVPLGAVGISLAGGTFVLPREVLSAQAHMTAESSVMCCYFRVENETWREGDVH